MITAAPDRRAAVRRSLEPAVTAVVLLAPLALAQGIADGLFFAPPLAASAAVLAATPGLPAAKPATVIAGHAVSVTAGLAAALLAGPGVLAALLGVGVAIAAMAGLGRMHAPAVASAGLVGAAGSAVGAAALLAGAIALVVLDLARKGIRSRITARGGAEIRSRAGDRV
ncbi:HPP family protein [Nocardia sp. NPDC127526]|uniref:HPP family protein n=1 Tax=Nocardia sp. NPDC127526 TaxID=3345393 RepID=UPI00362F84C7